MTVDAVGAVWMMHAQFETERSSEADAEVEYERHREQVYERKHGSLDGYVAGREFPCRGALREYDRTAGLALVACDSCPFQTSYRPDAEPAGARAW